MPGYQYTTLLLTALYRLDRLTSGVVVLGRHDVSTRKFMKDIVDRKVQKTYLARVVGEVPELVEVVS